MAPLCLCAGLTWGDVLRFPSWLRLGGLICLLRNLYAGQEATVRTGHGTTDWFQIGKGGRQGCVLSPCLFNLYAGYMVGASQANGEKKSTDLT